ncbi:MAG: hypothetical protein WBO14_07855, partial [Gammaproteobacteria bacterium]
LKTFAQIADFIFIIIFFRHLIQTARQNQYYSKCSTQVLQDQHRPKQHAFMTRNPHFSPGGVEYR